MTGHAWRSARSQIRTGLRWLLAGAAMASAGAQAQTPADATVAWLSEEFAPISFSTPAGPSGIAVDLLQAALQRGGLPPARPTLMPWARIVHLLGSTQPACVTTMTRTPQREASYRWAGPLVPDEIGAGRLPGAPPWPRTATPLAGQRVVVIRGDVSEDVARQLGVAEADLMRVGSPDNAARLVLSGRAKAWVHSDIGIRWTLLTMKRSPEELLIEGKQRVGDNYFACSLAVDPDYLRRLQRGLDELKQAAPNGVSTYDRIVDRYLKREPRPTP